MKGKIFGIGLSKTGTHSLTTALQRLGYKAGHWVIPPYHWQENAYGNFKTKLMKEYDAMTDIGVATHFEQLDLAYPNSRFILTLRHKPSKYDDWAVRDLSDWLESCRKAWAFYEDKLTRLSGGRGFYMTALYGAWHFNVNRWDYVYKRHVREVYNWFVNNGDEKRVLLLNLFNKKEDKMKKLCDFLDVKYPKNMEWPVKWVNSGRGNDEK